MIFRSIINLFLVFVAPFRALSRARAAPKGSTVQLELSGTLAEVVGPRRRFMIDRFLSREKRATSLWNVRELFDLAAADDRVANVLIVVQRLEAGWAKTHALAEAIALLAAKKRVHVHLAQGGGLKELVLAASATSASAPPNAHLFLVGMGGKAIYFKDALERVGVEADVQQRYEFKSAGEMFSRNGMSDEARAQSERLLDGISKGAHAIIAKKAKRDDLDALLSSGPYRTDMAISLGLLDTALWDDQLEMHLGAGGKKPREISATSYFARRRRKLFLPLMRKKRIAIVPISGTIVEEGAGAASKDLSELLHALKENRGVVGVVLCIDSRGGSAFGSAVIHRAAQVLAEKKPMIAFMSDYAASGGYYIAAAGERIFTSPMCVTGSIGVVSVRPIVDPLLEKLGLHKDGVQRGKHSGMLDATSRFTPEEKEAMKRLIDETYTEFTGVVQASRKMTAEKLDTLARGRVWLGDEAVRQGLADETGGLREAFNAMAAKLPKASREPAIVEPRKVKMPSWFRFLSMVDIDIIDPIRLMSAGLLTFEPLRID